MLFKIDLERRASIEGAVSVYALEDETMVLELPRKFDDAAEWDYYLLLRTGKTIPHTCLTRASLKFINKSALIAKEIISSYILFAQVKAQHKLSDVVWKSELVVFPYYKEANPLQ